MLRFIFQFLNKHFGYTRNEAIGFIFISLILLVSLILPFTAKWLLPVDEFSQSDAKLLDSLIAVIDQKKEIQLFKFDPNTCSEDSLLLLGIPRSAVSNLVKYRDKGGRFNSKSEIKKIYGIDDRLYNSIKNYINIIPEIIEENKEIVTTVKKAPKKAKLNINEVDENELKRISGIGDKLSARIVKYRDLLGGYVFLDQLNEVYNLPVETCETLKQESIIHEDFVPEKININSDEYKKILRHPYISKSLVQEIFAFRKDSIRHISQNEFREMKNLPDSIIVKLLPYIEF